MCASIGIALVAYGGGYLYYSKRVESLEAQANEHLREAERVLAAIPIWHKKIKTEQMLKLGVITDTHVHASRISKGDKRSDSPRYLKSQDAVPLRNFVRDMRVFQPEFIVHVGDVIEGTNEENVAGMQGLALAKKELDILQKPIHWVLGNHDLRAVTKEQFLQTLSQKELNYAFDAGDYRFVFLDGNKDVTLEELLADEAADAQKQENGIEEVVEEEDGSDGGEEETDNDHNLGGSIPREEIAWLKEQLTTDKRVFIFCHYPLFERQIISADGASKKSVPNAREMQAIFDEYRVDGVFAGHVEARMHFQEKLTHYYLMTGTKKSKTYPESYYELTIDAGKPDMRMFYTSPVDAEQYVMDFEEAQQVATGDINQNQ